MKILLKKTDGLIVPTLGNPNDAAFDITAISEPNIVGIKYERVTDGIMAWQKIEYISYRTGMFIEPQSEEFYDYSNVTDGGLEKPMLISSQKFHTLIFPRSSICKKNLVLANGVGIIDYDYRGEIEVRFKYIIQPEDLVVLPEAGRQKIYAIINPDTVYQKGDRIAQIKPSMNINIEFQLVESINNTKRSIGGFGSTN